jgi:hypothetical protein
MCWPDTNDAEIKVEVKDEVETPSLELENPVE